MSRRHRTILNHPPNKPDTRWTLKLVISTIFKALGVLVVAWLKERWKI